MKLTGRIRNVISGLCALVILVGASTIGVKYSFGAYEQGYELVARFDAAGQGLITGSDIKVRGLNVGHVDSIHLVDGHAEVTMFIEEGQRIPRDSLFTIRPKTLFGEKFIDVSLGVAEVSTDPDDFYDPEDPPADRVVPDEHAVGGVELERVLAGLYPILQAVDPAEVATVLDTLAAAGDGLGETINRSIVNGDDVLAVTAARDAETRQFLEALALLSEELSGRAPDLIAGAADLNVALPVLTENRESFTALLEQTERLSSELADLLEGNTAFIDSVYTDGQATLDVLFANRGQVIPLVTGLRQYVETLSMAARIPVGDGTVMAAVKGILGGDVCGLLGLITCGAATSPASTEASTARSDVLPSLPTIPLDTTVGPLTAGAQDLLDLVTGILGGAR